MRNLLARSKVPAVKTRSRMAKSKTARSPLQPFAKWTTQKSLPNTKAKFWAKLSGAKLRRPAASETARSPGKPGGSINDTRRRNEDERKRRRSPDRWRSHQRLVLDLRSACQGALPSLLPVSPRSFAACKGFPRVRSAIDGLFRAALVD